MKFFVQIQLSSTKLFKTQNPLKQGLVSGFPPDGFILELISSVFLLPVKSQDKAWPKHCNSSLANLEKNANTRSYLILINLLPLDDLGLHR